MMKVKPMTTYDSNTPARSFPALLTIKQTAEHLQVSTRTIRRWIEAGDLIAHRMGHQFRISETDLQTFIKTRREA
jgi:excisionase family DNA binding protein